MDRRLLIAIFKGKRLIEPAADDPKLLLIESNEASFNMLVRLSSLYGNFVTKVFSSSLNSSEEDLTI